MCLKQLILDVQCDRLMCELDGIEPVLIWAAIWLLANLSIALGSRHDIANFTSDLLNVRAFEEVLVEARLDLSTNPAALINTLMKL